MNFPLFVAKRYFFSAKKRSFINVISIISMVGVGLGVGTLIVVLSVFNGLEDLLRSLYSSFDSDAKITLVEGKSFDIDSKLMSDIKHIDGVDYVTQVYEDNALLRYNNADMVVRLKGVDTSYLNNERFGHTIVEGSFSLGKEGLPLAVVGRGVKYALSIAIKNDFYPLQFLIPKNIKPGKSNPSDLLVRKSIMPEGVFAIEKQIDENYVIAPIDFVRSLFSKSDKVSGLEVYLSDDADQDESLSKIRTLVGKEFKVLNKESQHAHIYRLLKIEKLFVFGTFTFVLLIASFNIFFTLSMLAIEKKEDLLVFRALGLSRNAVHKIFIMEGVLIAGTGAVAGLFFGLAICLIQQYTGIISMGMEASIIDGYPIKIKLFDVFISIMIIAIITFLASYRPAVLAAKTIIKK